MTSRSGDLPDVRRVVAGDDEAALVEFGNPSGRPAVLLSGLSDGLAPLHDPATRRMLAHVPLPMERFRGLAVSYPDLFDTAATTRTLAASVATVLRSVLEEPAVVFGHSLGAMVAQHLAVDAPELVAALVLSAPTGRSDQALRAVLARWEGWLREGASDRFFADAVAMSFTGEERSRRLAAVTADPPPTPPAERVARHLALSRACAAHDALERVGDVRVPTLLVAGGHDVLVPVEHAQTLAAAVPGAQLDVVPDVGHAFPEQAPERYEVLVGGFLATTYAARPPAGEAPR